MMRVADLTSFEQKSKLAVLLFIASEATFFVFLIVAYAYYNYDIEHGPTAATSLHPLRTGLFTIALLASSATVVIALRALDRGAYVRYRWWMLSTVVLGAVFLFGQAREYVELLRHNVTISRNLFGTTFFTLTGFHGIHVLIGLVLLAVACACTFGQTIEIRRKTAVEAISYYWHFVDVVWIVIFSMIYLWTARPW